MEIAGLARNDGGRDALCGESGFPTETFGNDAVGAAFRNDTVGTAFRNDAVGATLRNDAVGATFENDAVGATFGNDAVAAFHCCAISTRRRAV
jgi:hypothetical protein